MLSKETLALPRHFLAICHYFCLSPIIWDPNTKKFKPSTNADTKFANTVFYANFSFLICFHIFFSLCLIWILLTNDTVDISELIFGSCCINVLLLAVPIYVLYFDQSTIAGHINGLIGLNHITCKLLKLNKNSSDGVENVVKVLFITPLIGMVSGVVGLTIIPLENVPVVRLVNFFPDSVVRNLVLVYYPIAFICGIQWSMVSLVASIILLHCNSTSIWLKRVTSEWTTGRNVSETRKKSLRVLQRAIQIHHNFTNYYVRYLLPTFLPIGETIVITSTFVVLRYHSQSHLLVIGVLLCIAVMGLTVMKTSMDRSFCVTEASQNFTMSLYNNIELTSYDKKFFVSCQTLQWRIGGTFVISKNSFPVTFHSVVVENVVTLLLSSR